jgi:tRNA threonylcarbamoyladenosine biosynthesis protein TsaB
MKALAIDTSTNTMGVAIIDQAHVLGEIITTISKNHSVRLMPAVQSLMKEVGVSPNELEKVVVAIGPGSYTGVRIGVTIAKTLAWSLKIPITGVSTLEVLAQNGSYFDGAVCPLIDARRGRVYTGLYENIDGHMQTIVDEQNVLFKDWLEMIKEKANKVLFVGTDVSIHSKQIDAVFGAHAQIAAFSSSYPRPAELARIGLQKENDDIHTLVPNYLRLAEAEAKWLALKEN